MKLVELVPLFNIGDKVVVHNFQGVIVGINISHIISYDVEIDNNIYTFNEKVIGLVSREEE